MATQKELHHRLFDILQKELTDEDVAAFKNHALARGLRRGEVSRMRNLTEILNAMETKGIIGINKYDDLKQIFADDMDSPAFNDYVLDIEEKMRALSLTAGQNKPWLPETKSTSSLVTVQHAPSQDIRPVAVGRPFAADDECYSTGKGYLLLINNFTATRTGTEIDERNLLKFFQGTLRFDVDIKRDLIFEQLQTSLSSAQQLLKRGIQRGSEIMTYSQFFCAILSHGNKDGIKTINGTYVPLNDIASYFKGDRLPQMAGKPKVFLVQACRGELDQQGVMLQSDDREEDAPVPMTTPVDADELIAYATTEGYRSWRREEKGSWFIHHLTQTFQQCYQSEHVMDMLTIVNRQVSCEQTAGSELVQQGVKQMPCQVSSLTKKLYLMPGSS